MGQRVIESVRHPPPSGRMLGARAPAPTPGELADLLKSVAERRDREAFARLFDHFAPRINGFLLRLGLETNAAEEVTQDVLTTLWRKAEAFDRAKSSVATWLYCIARNRCIDVLRHDRNVARDHDALTVFDEMPTVDDSLDASRREHRVRAALAVLPAEQLALVRLSFFEGLSHSEIADRTGLPLGTVKSRIRLAFSRLRRALEDAGIDEAG